MLTKGNADDAAQVSALLRQVEGSIASVMADGAYDGEPVYRAAAGCRHDPPPDVIIPPRATAVPSTDDVHGQTGRDRQVHFTAETGGIGWQRASGYGRRDHVEAVIGR